MTDLVYLKSGMFATFIPNTSAGEDAWRSIAAQTDGTGKVLMSQLKSTLSQLRGAGYSVRQTNPAPAHPNRHKAFDKSNPALSRNNHETTHPHAQANSKPQTHNYAPPAKTKSYPPASRPNQKTPP